MATIRVTCPTCKQELEIDSQHIGQEVECGSCLQVFVAKDPNDKGPPARKPYKARRDDDEDEDEKPRKKKKRRRDDDDDYGDYDDDYDRPARGSGGGSGLAVISLVLGILSLPMACCCGLFSLPVSLGATITGGIAMKNPEGKGMAVTGLILGILGIILCIVALAIGVGMNLNNPGQFKGFGR